jgi:hypothetical protein
VARVTRFTTAATAPIVLTLVRSRGWHCQRREAPQRLHIALHCPNVVIASDFTASSSPTLLYFDTDAMADSSSSSNRWSVTSYPPHLSLVFYSRTCIYVYYSKCQRTHPLDLLLDDPIELTEESVNLKSHLPVSDVLPLIIAKFTFIK